MGIILKNAFKNISSKKGRTFILVFCVFVTSVVAMLALDMTSSIKSAFSAYMTESLGDVDLMIESVNPDVMDGVEGYKGVKLGFAGQFEYRRDNELYMYSFKEPVSVFCFDDYEMAYELGQLNTLVSMSDDEVYVSTAYAEKYDVKAGDKITLGCVDESSIEVTVKEIIAINPFSLLHGNSIIATPETCRRVSCTLEIPYLTTMVKLDKETDKAAFKETVMKNDPTAAITDFQAEMDEADIEQIYSMFYLVFLFVFLLVIFVTVSFSEKIVNERMSTIGTLRSIGVTQKMTSMILLLENVLYGFIGSLLGCALYAAVRVPFLSNVIKLEASTGDSLDVASVIGTTPFYTYILVVVGAIIVETLAPMLALSKSVKMSIRDIIFANKDTEFKYSWARAYVGGVLVLVGVIASFLNKSFVGLCVSIVAIVVAIATLIPFLLKGISILGTKVIKPGKTPILKMALSEISNNKTLVNTAVMCVSTLILSTCIYSFSDSLRKEINRPSYDCDIIVENINDKDEFFYSFIKDVDGVTDVEFHKATTNEIRIDNKVFDQNILPWQESTMFMSGQDLGDVPSENEVILTKTVARRFDLKVGDTVNITFNDSYILKQQGDYVVVNIIDKGLNNGIYINPHKYEMLFKDIPSEIGIRCEEGRVDEVRALLEKYIVSDEDCIRTLEEITRDEKEQKSGIIGILTALIVLGFTLTIIGVSGNQSIGFENRRREMAVLYSVAMSRSKLKRLLILENAISIALSAVTAFAISPFLIKNFASALVMVTGGDLPEITFDIGVIGVYMVAAFAVIMLTNIIPVRRIKKMNCSLELKYE
ncbi:MAG: FtsX-like permease family protein [Saccharofermentans sp.]|nr:FtsX-like permease family protein [Saccharofermentans sp.]